MEKRVLSLLVENTAGVLNRISGLFSRRGYNIDSLTVGITEDPRYSRMTIVVSGSGDILEQIEKQIAKLIDVVEVTELKSGESVCRELILIKVLADVTTRQQVIAIADIFRAKIVDVCEESLIMELTGAQTKVDAFLRLLQGFEIKELVRTGLTGLLRGSVTEA